jgi:ATP-binding cassette, subfamily B, bacterial
MRSSAAPPVSAVACLVRAFALALSSTRWLLVGAVGTQILASVSPVLLLVWTKRLVDGVVEEGPRSELVTVTTMLVVVVVVQRLAGLAQSSLITLARERASAAAVTEYLRKAATLDAAHLDDPAFHDQMRDAGEVADSRFDSVVFHLVGLVGALSALAGLVTLMASISPLVAILVVASMVPWVLAEQHGFRIVRTARWKLVTHRRRQAYLRGLVTDGAASLELQASGAGRTIAERHRDLADEVLRAERPAHLRQFLTISAGNLIGGGFLVVAFVVAALDAARGGSTPGEVAAVIAALGAFLHTTAGLANAVSGLLGHAPYLKGYYAFLAAPVRLPVAARPLRLPEPLGSVVFDAVTFTYPGASRPALDNVTLEIRPGELVALVGDNGAGKSTFVKLLLRFYDPDSGAVRVGGVDLRHCDPGEIRSRTAVLFQDFARYQFTLGEVVAMGRPDVPPDPERLLEAVHSAGLAGFLARLPTGLDSPVGRLFPGGTDLSGGQWQRLGLARVYYRAGEVLVLDEPTSALDPQAEADTFAHVRATLGGRMGLVISHRFSTVRAADRIAVLDDARLVEYGSHDELLALGGRYARLFRLQAAAYE